MTDIFNSDLNSGFQAGDINVDNDKNIADDGAVILNDSDDNAVATGRSVANSGDDADIAANTGTAVSSTIASGDVEDTISGNNNAQINPDNSDIGALSFGSGSASNVEDSLLVGSAAGNSGPTALVQGNEGVASGFGDASSDDDNLTSIKDSVNSNVTDDGTTNANQANEDTDVDVVDSFKSFEDNKSFEASDDDTVISRSEDVDLDF